MKVFTLSKLGKRVSSGEGSTDEMRVLHKIRDMGKVRDDELMGDDIYIIRKLKDNGLVMELTS